MAEDEGMRERLGIIALNLRGGRKSVAEVVEALFEGVPLPAAAAQAEAAFAEDVAILRQFYTSHPRGKEAAATWDVVDIASWTNEEWSEKVSDMSRSFRRKAGKKRNDCDARDLMYASIATKWGVDPRAAFAPAVDATSSPSCSLETTDSGASNHGGGGDRDGRPRWPTVSQLLELAEHEKMLERQGSPRQTQRTRPRARSTSGPPPPARPPAAKVAMALAGEDAGLKETAAADLRRQVSEEAEAVMSKHPASTAHGSAVASTGRHRVDDATEQDRQAMEVPAETAAAASSAAAPPPSHTVVANASPATRTAAECDVERQTVEEDHGTGGEADDVGASSVPSADVVASAPSVQRSPQPVSAAKEDARPNAVGTEETHGRHIQETAPTRAAQVRPEEGPEEGREEALQAEETREQVASAEIAQQQPSATAQASAASSTRGSAAAAAAAASTSVCTVAAASVSTAAAATTVQAPAPAVGEAQSASAVTPVPAAAATKDSAASAAAAAASETAAAAAAGGQEPVEVQAAVLPVVAAVAVAELPAQATSVAAAVPAVAATAAPAALPSPQTGGQQATGGGGGGSSSGGGGGGGGWFSRWRCCAATAPAAALPPTAYHPQHDDDGEGDNDGGGDGGLGEGAAGGVALPEGIPPSKGL